MRINRSTLHQLLRCPLLSDNTVKKHNYLIRAADSPHPVGDNENRLILNQLGKRALNLRLVLNVQACSRLV